MAEYYPPDITHQVAKSTLKKNSYTVNVSRGYASKAGQLLLYRTHEIGMLAINDARHTSEGNLVPLRALDALAC